MTKFTVGSQKPLITVGTMVNERGPFNFVVDTGASHTVISVQTAEKLGLSLQSAKCCERARGAGGPVSASTISLESLRVDDVEVRDIDVAVMDLTDLSKTLQQTLDGIIGKNYMENYKVVIDYPKQQISFEKS